MKRHHRAKRVHNRSNTAASTPIIAVVGGQGRWRNGPADVQVRAFPSTVHGGNGRRSSALSAVRSGAIDLVVLLVRWLGHPESRLIMSACRRHDIPVRVVAGGVAMAIREIRRFMEGRHHVL